MRACGCFVNRQKNEAGGVRELLRTRISGYDRALLELRTLNIELSGLVYELTDKAMGALAGKEGLPDWREADNRIDRLRDEVVNRSFAMMSLQQLTPKNLRWILGHQRISQELERIADYACDVAELNSLRAAATWPAAILEMASELMKMFDFVVSALREDKAIDRNLNDHDDVLDVAYVRLQQALVENSQRGGQAGMDVLTGADSLAFSLILARTLERTGDHIVNVAEMLVYIETGQRRLN